MESTASSRNPPGRPSELGGNRAEPSAPEIFGDVGQSAREPSADRQVCPYCGLAGQRSDSGGPCPRCTIEDSPQTRQATKARIGPWYVLQTRNPAAPGMKWSVLMALVKKGQVTPRSIVRGPTTHQLWRLASQVKGLSREFGLCYSCGLEISRSTNQCPHCDRLQEPPANPDALLESRDLPTAGRRATVVAPAQFEAPDSTAVATPPGGAIATRHDQRADGGLLTARELATAFQLDLHAPGGMAVPASIAATTAPADQPPRRRRVALVLAMLSLVGLGAIVWFTPEYRAAAEGYWRSGRDWTVARWQAWRGSGDSAAARQPAADAPARASGDASPAAEAQASSRGNETIQRVESRDPAPPVSPPVVVDPQTLTEQARSLRRSAIDAEAAGDFARAVRLYEQIAALPREYWPGDLQVRLDAARQRSK